MNSNNGGFNAQQMQMISKMLDYYNKNGEDRLVKDIFANVAAQKKQGKLTNEQIKQFVKNVSPMLDAKQRQRLDELVEELLKI